MYRPLRHHLNLRWRAGTGVFRVLQRLISLPALWLHRHRMRHELSQLDATQLRDVGLNAERTRREAAKPFWQE